jgi:thioredoxin 1
MGNGVLEISDATFQRDVINSTQPVLVDFWAPWCGPCRMIAPVVEELAMEYAGSVKIVKVNIDDNSHSAEAYGVSSIPTLLVFKGGQIVNSFVGVQSKSKIQQALDAAKG